MVTKNASVADMIQTKIARIYELTADIMNLKFHGLTQQQQLPNHF